MITVGFDFGTHQTKICYETVEAGTTLYDVFRFDGTNGNTVLTLPSFIRISPDGTLRFGHEAVSSFSQGKSITYFKQIMFSWTSGEKARSEAEQWSVLYLAFVIFMLDKKFLNNRYVVQMGMPTDADPHHYNFCKRQAIKVMASAMLLARSVFKGNMTVYLSTSWSQLADLAAKCMAAIPSDIHEARKRFPIFVFPEAYVALLPLINDRRLPNFGPNLFVDIGGGTVDISFFTAHEGVVPWLYYYYSMPCGLNMITGQGMGSGHNVEVEQGQITNKGVEEFRRKMINAVDAIILTLKQLYIDMGRTNVMPFTNLCGQIFDGRPICYSGGGSMFHRLRLPMVHRPDGHGFSYNFSHITTVSELINHSSLYVDEKAFHVLATAFALSHHALVDTARQPEPDSIRLAPVERLFLGIHNPLTDAQRTHLEHEMTLHYMVDMRTSSKGLIRAEGKTQPSTLVGKDAGERVMQKCPHCGALVSMRKMNRHIRRVHANRAGNKLNNHHPIMRRPSDPEDIQRELYGDW